MKIPFIQQTKSVQLTSGLFKFSFISLTGTIVSLIVAGVMLYVLVIQGVNKQLSTNIVASHAQSYAEFFNQRLTQINTQVKYLASLNNIDQLLGEEQDYNAANASLLSIVNYIPDLVAIKLFPVGVVSLSPEKYQLGFPIIDMINHAERGELPAAEIHNYGEIKTINVVYPVMKNDSTQSILLVRFSLNALKKGSQKFNNEYGAMKLEQVFPDTPSQVIMSVGFILNNEQPIIQLKLTNPYLKVSFQPSIQLINTAVVSQLSVLGILVLTMLVIVSSILISYFRLNKDIRINASMLVTYSRSLILGTPKKAPIFSLALFESMAQTLASTKTPPSLSANTKALNTTSRVKNNQTEIKKAGASIVLPDTIVAEVAEVAGIELDANMNKSDDPALKIAELPPLDMPLSNDDALK